MKRTAVLTWVGALVLAGIPAASSADAAKPVPAPPKPKADKHIDLVICLDTSGSMRGLIESAKQKLWAVVSELATAKPRPILRVGLYHYGNDGLDPKTGWVQQLCELTSDLDKVYSLLFPLRTNGGTEYVARVVKAATDELKWNPDKGTLRMIFVAGNEPATQDKALSLQDICKAAITKGIIVNTIHCGPDATGRQTGWADAARWADGQYAWIDQDHGTVVIATPYDKKLADLSVEINTTYVAYGDAGKAGAHLQAAMEGAASQVSSAAHAERAQAKASGLYRNVGWDLLDALKEGTVDLAKLAEKDMPEEMRKMTPDQRKAYVAAKAKRREEIQKEIQDLTAKRQAHIQAETTKRGLNEKHAFDAVLRAAVRHQAEQHDFKFEK